MNIIVIAVAGGGGLVGILIGFLILIIVLAVIAGLVWCIEQWIHPLPPTVKLILALILVILVIIWAVEMFTGQSFHVTP